MNKKNWSVLARTALAFVFVFGQTARATQGQNAMDKSSSNKAVKARQASANATTAVGAKSQSTEEETASEENSAKREESNRGGQHEGIKVHGHWSIEVHNPDGSLVRHVEFENSLDPGFATGFSVPNLSATLIFPGGAAYLNGLLSGQWSPPIAPVAWQIWLVGPSGLGAVFNPNATNPPCLATSGTTTANVTFTACRISQAVPTCTAGPAITCNLSVIPLGTAPTLTGIQLSGSVVATQNGQVSTVATIVFGAICQPSGPNCPVSTPGASQASGIAGASFTSSTNFPGAPISVSAGQTIAVTVNISFS